MTKILGNLIVIVGAGNTAKVVIDIIEKQEKYVIEGLIDRNRNTYNEAMEYRILGDENILPNLIENKNIIGCVIALGDNILRYKIANSLKKNYPKLQFINAIHPSAQIAKNVEINAGVIIMPGVIVNSRAKIGFCCLLNTKSSIDHDSVMHDFSSLAPGVTIGGCTTIGRFSAISLGANVINNINIGENTVIGAGALVLKNIGPNLIAYGVPCKEIKEHRLGDKYF